MKTILIALLKGYKKYVSPCIPRSCKFTPTCSEYAQEAINEYGVFKGSLKSIWRVLRCNPFSRAGYDPVIKH